MTVIQIKALTFCWQRSLIASVIARLTTYCTNGTTLPSSICIVYENSKLPFGDSHTFFDRPSYLPSTNKYIKLQQTVLANEQ